MPLDRAGVVPNDLNEACAYTQQTIKGVCYFYQPPTRVVADSMAVIIFKDPHCPRSHVPGAGLVAAATHVNAEIAKAWLSAPERATVAVSQLKIPKDKSVQGLCLKSFASAYALGKLINEYCNSHHIYPIPDPLRIYCTRGRKPPPVLSPTGTPPDNQPLFPARPFVGGAFGTNVGWMNAQIRVSWIIKDVLTANPHIFPGLPVSQRCHQLEAALFMMGA